MNAAAVAAPQGFAVARWVGALGGFIARHPRLWIALGNLETRLVQERIATLTVDRPIYIAGLARSGSTILLELLAGHPQVATHRYRDYPPVYTPYLWNRWLDRIPRKAEQAAPRTHADGIAVTSESPEAFEEVLWMAFFPGLHDPERSAVLDRDTQHPAFERFYREHLRKLLAVRGGGRYAAKGNYHVTRLAYLARLHPDARFLVPVRAPVWHIASLMKQHALFLAGTRAHPRALAHLDRVGHFEFGPHRRPIHTGDAAAAAQVRALWGRGEEVMGWARYWAMVHAHLAAVLAGDPQLRAAVRVVRYEELCARPRETLAAILEHCGLDAPPGFVDTAAARLRFPDYYAPRFTPHERALIARETAAAAAHFGYAPAAHEIAHAVTPAT